MGIDPGSNCTGYGIVEEIRGQLRAVHWRGIKARMGKSFPERLRIIYSELSAAIETHRPEAVAVEDVFFAVNVKSALKLGQARGAAILAAANAGLEIAEYSPLAVKQAVTGYGRAEKAQVQAMVARLLSLRAPIEPFDASDALAIAICHIHSAAPPRTKRSCRRERKIDGGA
jgi:crossover junction endodeoxyribonuclease RuvC